jgi:hypothetical protein
MQMRNILHQVGHILRYKVGLQLSEFLGLLLLSLLLLVDIDDA